MLFMSCVCHAFASVHCCLWSPEGKGLTSWLLLVMFIVILFSAIFRDDAATVFAMPITDGEVSKLISVCIVTSLHRIIMLLGLS